MRISDWSSDVCSSDLPRWYEAPELHVPTWNYATVHIVGRPQLGDLQAARESVTALTAHFDPSFQAADDHVERLLAGIVAFVMPIERLVAKLKMNQKRRAANTAGLIVAVDRRGRKGVGAGKGE